MLALQRQTSADRRRRCRQTSPTTTATSSAAPAASDGHGVTSQWAGSTTDDWQWAELSSDNHVITMRSSTLAAECSAAQLSCTIQHSEFNVDWKAVVSLRYVHIDTTTSSKYGFWFTARTSFTRTRIHGHLYKDNSTRVYRQSTVKSNRPNALRISNNIPLHR